MHKNETKEDRVDYITSTITETYLAYQKKINPTLMEVFIRLLSKYPIDSIADGVTAHFADTEQGQFAPLPASIIRHIEGSKKAKASLAWEKVKSAIQKVGPWSSVAFDDPYIHIVISQMGGWTALNSMEYNELNFFGNDFKHIYGGYVTKPLSSLQWPNVLLGSIDQSAGGKGLLSTKNIKLMGERQAAIKTLQFGSNTKELNQSLLSSLPTSGLPNIPGVAV